MSKKEDAVAKLSPLAMALSGAKSAITKQDYDANDREKPMIVYVGLRQKDKKDEKTGKTIRAAGLFRISDPAKPEEPSDREELTLSILAFSEGRVFFEEVDDTTPKCKSNDGKRGSREREGDKFGTCPTCRLSQWGSSPDGRMACTELRNIIAMDWATEKPVVLTLGPSSLKPFRKYDLFIQENAMAAFGPDEQGRAPFSHHLMMVKVRPIYQGNPQPHFIVEFHEPSMLPESLWGQMKEMRKMAREQFGTIVEARAIGEEVQHGTPPPATPVEATPAPAKPAAATSNLPF